MVRIGKDLPDWVVTIRGGILAYMYLYCAPHPNQSNHLPAILAYKQCRWLSHMVFFQGKLYALDSNTDPEDLIAIDIVDDDDCHEPRVSRIERLIEGASLPPQKYFRCQCYLLESHGTTNGPQKALLQSRAPA